MKNISTIVFVLIVLFWPLPSCKKASDEVPTWGEKYTGKYLFTTIYHDYETGAVNTTMYNGTISVQDESRHLLKIEYQPNSTIYPNVSDIDTLYLDPSGGNHSSFTGKFDVNRNIEFNLQNFWWSWHVYGKKL